MTDLALVTIRIARSYLGKQEPGPLPNRGPNVDTWLAFVGIRPVDGEKGAPWCAAMASWCVYQAATELHISTTFRKSAGALRLLDVNADLRITEPEDGALVIWDHGGGKGHVGIVTGVTRVGSEVAGISVVAGNTSADGMSRDADSVAERGFPFPSARQIAGYLAIR